MKKSSVLYCLLILLCSLFQTDPGFSAETDSKATLSQMNRALSSGEETVTVVCFGDSVTGLYYHTGGIRTYTDMLGIALQKTYPKARLKMVNAGISGHTTANGLARIEKDVLAQKPDLVTIMFGLNDMVRVPLPDYKRNLDTIVSHCRGVGARVILCTPNSVITTSNRPSEKLENYCDAVRQVALENNVVLCDTYQTFENLRKKDYDQWRLNLSDEIHPNMSGHKLIAETISETVTDQPVSLNDIDPPFPAIAKTKGLLKTNQEISVLAMKPFDELIEKTIHKINPDSKLKITSWDPKGKTVSQLETEAKKQVRNLKPDLVLIAAPGTIQADSREQFIRSYTWLMNWSLSFGKQEWDCVVVHPSVLNPDESNKNDELVRTLVRGQDLTLIDRPAGNTDPAEKILEDWFKVQLGEK